MGRPGERHSGRTSWGPLSRAFARPARSGDELGNLAPADASAGAILQERQC